MRRGLADAEIARTHHHGAPATPRSSPVFSVRNPSNERSQNRPESSAIPSPQEVCVQDNGRS